MSAIGVLTRSAVSVNVRQPATVLFGFAMPIGIILVFQLIGDGLMGNASVANQAVPGILAYSVTNASLSASALTFTAWRNNGMLTRLRLEPVGAGEVVFSRYLVTLAITVLQALVFVGLGTAFLGLDLDWQFWWLGLTAIILASLAFFAIGAVIGFLASSEQAVSAGLNLILLPVAFLSGCFIPLSSLSPVVGEIMQFTPLAALTTGLVDSMNGVVDGTTALWVFMVLLAWAILAALAVTQVYRRRVDA